MPPTSVHFNGSINLPDAEAVMREISSRISYGVRRMTDGETGDRNYWISFQTRKFEQMPEFETVSVGQAYETAPDAPDMPQLRLTEGASAEMIHWPDLGYADEYTKSFATFERMQNDGTIPSTGAAVTDLTQSGSRPTDGTSRRSISPRRPWLTPDRRPRPPGGSSPRAWTWSRPI